MEEQKYFIARYKQDGKEKSLAFDKRFFDEEKAAKLLNDSGVQNFMFFFRPNEPMQIDENTYLFNGDVGFDITLSSLLPYIRANNDILIDTFGGDLFEAYRIKDVISRLPYTSKIGTLGVNMSAGTIIQMAVPIKQRTISKNSRFLVHNPHVWAIGDDQMFLKKSQELKEEKENIARIYAESSDLTEEEAIELMQEERILTAEEAIEKGFFLAEYMQPDEETENNNNNSQTMNNKEKKEKLNVFQAAFNDLKAAVLGSDETPKALILQDVNGAVLDFGQEIETEEEISVGSAVTVRKSTKTEG
jgi:ATP-dependent protease ClpP protease subunit